MGNTTATTVNLTYENIKKLEQIGVEIININLYHLTKTQKETVINLYKTFYYPTHCLTKLEEMNRNHYHLRNILRKNIELYNKYNLTNIDVEHYITTTVKNLQPTLRVIGV